MASNFFGSFTLGYPPFFSNSLIIQCKKRKFWFYFSIRFPLISSLDLEDLSTLDSVDRHGFQKPPRSLSKITPLRVLFPTLFSLFRNVLKLGLSCLIYYVNTHIKFYFLQTRVVRTTVSSYRTERNSQMRHAQLSWNAEMASFTISSAQAPLLCRIPVSIRCWRSDGFRENVVKWTGRVKWARCLLSSQQGWCRRLLWTWSDVGTQWFCIGLNSRIRG